MNRDQLIKAFSATVQASLHGQVIHPSSVAEIVSRVNDLIVRSTDPHMFATFLYGELDVGSGRFECVNAGHDPALWRRHQGCD